jgi:hypothetical protein
LEKEKNEKEYFGLRLELFNAYFNLKKFSEAISIGEQLIKEDITFTFR